MLYKPFATLLTWSEVHIYVLSRWTKTRAQVTGWGEVGRESSVLLAQHLNLTARESVLRKIAKTGEKIQDIKR